MYRKIMLPALFFLCFDCFSQPHKLLKDELNKVTISFKLKKSEKCILAYTDAFLTLKYLTFNNESDNDTLIHKYVYSKIAVTPGYNIMVTGKNKQIHIMHYALLANPGDTLRLSFSHGMYLNTTECKKSNVLSDTTTSYYTSENFIKEKKGNISIAEAWNIFYPAFNIKYDSEIQRIENLFKAAQIDLLTHNRLIINCKLHYYKRMFDWVFQKDNRYFKPAVMAITQDVPQIEDLLNEKDIITTNELLNVVDGLIYVKVINNGRDYNNVAELYKEASNANLGQFKGAYLSVLILKSPVKISVEFKKMLADFTRKYEGTSNKRYLDSVLNNNPEFRNFTFTDKLSTLSGQITPLSKLISSKKRYVLIDFWASWCGPCRYQLPYLDSIRKVMKDYPIDFISINMDKKTEAWRLASKEESKYLIQNNYHLINLSESPLIKYLKVTEIPRYVILDRTQILSSDFYQPTDPAFKKELIKLIKSK